MASLLVLGFAGVIASAYLTGLAVEVLYLAVR